MSDPLRQLQFRTCLRQDCLILRHHFVLQLDRDRLGLVLLFLLLVIFFLWLRRKPTGLLVASQSGFEHTSDEVIRTEHFTRLQILDHPVGEPCDVAGGLEHGCWGHDSGVHFEHVLFHDEVFAPFCDDVALERRARRTVIV